MKIRSVEVKNFRSILDETLNLDDLTVLVGSNSAGKSSFIKAIEIFQKKSPDIDENDFYNGQTDQKITIRVAFKDLTDEEKKIMAAYARGDDLVIERELSLSEEPRFFGLSHRIPEFRAILENTAAGAKDAYTALREGPKWDECLQKWGELPQKWTSRDKIAEKLAEIEDTNPDCCREGRDDATFFGFGAKYAVDIGTLLQVLLVPAVHEASDDAETKKDSALAKIMHSVLEALKEDKEFKALQDDTQAEYTMLMSVYEKSRLMDLGMDVTDKLQKLVPGAEITLSWSSTDLEIMLPQATAKLGDGGYEAPVDRTGHGLQRAFVMAMLEQLSTSGAAPCADGRPPPLLVVAIEEPELYQHPDRQRYLASKLLEMAQDGGAKRPAQVVYTTHSPYFVGMDRIDQIRRVKKERTGSGAPMASRVYSTGMDRLAARLANLSQGASHTPAETAARLHAIMTPWANEGFFADAVVLVEGEGDREVLMAFAKNAHTEFESLGITIVPCMGIQNMDRMLIIFQDLNIPTYVVWDNDLRKASSGGDDVRARLSSLLSANLDGAATRCGENFACFKDKIETTLEDEMGEDFDPIKNESIADLGMRAARKPLKNPKVLSLIVKKAHERGIKCATFEGIIEKIVLMRKGGIA